MINVENIHTYVRENRVENREKRSGNERLKNFRKPFFLAEELTEQDFLIVSRSLFARKYVLLTT